MNIKFQSINNFTFKNLITLCVIVLVTAACGGASTKTTSVVSLDSWEEFVLEQGNFSILFPATPRERIQMLPGSDIGNEIYTYQVQDGQATFAVTYNDFGEAEAQPDTQLDRIRDELLDSLAASLIAEESIAMIGHPGRHVEFSFNDPNMVGGGVGVVRLFVVDERLYQVSVIGPSAELTRGEIEQFLTSFTMLEPTLVDVEINPRAS